MTDKKSNDAIKMDVVNLDKSETYPKKCYMKMVYTNIYISWMSNTKDKLLTLSEKKYIKLRPSP